MYRFTVETGSAFELIDITDRVQSIIGERGVDEGLCCVYVPHTTAAVTINENADPDVQSDLLKGLGTMVPLEAEYRHGEGNSAAHIKASLMGASQTVIVEGGRLVLGTWQSVFFCEFDGPRRREVWVSFTGSHAI